jgi:hypothetical protein
MKSRCRNAAAWRNCRCTGGMADNGSRENRKNRKNRKIDLCPFSNCNLLRPNLFRPKVPTGILRIIRNFLRVGVWGGEGRKKEELGGKNYEIGIMKG